MPGVVAGHLGEPAAGYGVPGGSAWVPGSVVARPPPAPPAPGAAAEPSTGSVLWRPPVETWSVHREPSQYRTKCRSVGSTYQPGAVLGGSGRPCPAEGHDGGGACGAAPHGGAAGGGVPPPGHVGEGDPEGDPYRPAGWPGAGGPAGDAGPGEVHGPGGA